MNSAIIPGNSKTLILSESFLNLLCSLSGSSKIAKILCRGLSTQQRLGKTQLFSNNLQFNWITWRETSGLISYYPTNRGEQPINEEGKWVRKGRQDMRISAWAKTALSPKILKKLTDGDFNLFSTLFKREEKAGELKCEILSGEENINDIYGEEKFLGGHDCSNGSCMHGENVGEFYKKIGADIAICRDGNGKLVGRAILWPEIKFNKLDKSLRFLDRIYSLAPEYQSFMLEWAKGRGFVVKASQNKEDKNYFKAPFDIYSTYNNFCDNVKFEAPSGINDIIFNPYLDTFTRLSPDSGEKLYFYNDENEDDYEGWLYNDTDGCRGKLNPHIGQVQDIDGDWISEDDAIEVEGDYYSEGDERICKCHRDERYYLIGSMKMIHLSRSETIYIHEKYVDDME